MQSSTEEDIHPCPEDVVMINDDDNRNDNSVMSLPRSQESVVCISESKTKSKPNTRNINLAKERTALVRFYNQRVKQVRCKNCNKLGHTRG